MVQKRLTERPRGRRGKYNFGASANKHSVGQTKLAETEWRRDVHDFVLYILSPTSGEKVATQVLGSPGTGFTREIRRVAFHGGLAVVGQSPNPTNLAGVVEVVLGLAESSATFTQVLGDTEAGGMFRRYITIAQGAGAFKFWIPSGFNQLGAGEATASGGPMELYVGLRVMAFTEGYSAGAVRLAGIISTQEKELRVYS